MEGIALAVAVETISVLAYAILVSSYERRGMAYLHERDGPTVYGVLGLVQPLVEGAKLLLKGTT